MPTSHDQGVLLYRVEHQTGEMNDVCGLSTIYSAGREDLTMMIFDVNFHPDW